MRPGQDPPRVDAPLIFPSHNFLKDIYRLQCFVWEHNAPRDCDRSQQCISSNHRKLSCWTSSFPLLRCSFITKLYELAAGSGSA